MTLSRETWARLSRPIAVSLTLSAAACCLLLYEQYALNRARQALDTRTKAVANLEQQLARQQADRQNQASWQETFETLRDRGLVGPAQKRDWMKSLHDLRDTFDIPDLRYEFGPEQILGNTIQTGHAWHLTPMQLQMATRHELELLHTLESLRAQPGTLLIIRYCKLSRNGTTPLLLASCKMDWLKLHAIGVRQE